MGMFSYSCGVCEQEILNGGPEGYKKFSAAFAFWPNGDRVSTDRYEGYGDIGSAEMNDEMYGESPPRFAHKCCYTGQAFDELKPDNGAPHQGFWPGERNALKLYGPPNLDEITKEQEYVCVCCLRVWESKWTGGICAWGCKRPEDAKSYFELVEPFEHLYLPMDKADGLGICHNRQAEVGYQGKEIGECYRFGITQQIRVATPDEFDVHVAPGPYVPRCSSCRDVDQFEVLKLIRGPLPLLASAMNKH